jgi:hypothetical protein
VSGPILTCGGLRYRWHEPWAAIPASEPAGWAHHGLAVTADGTILAAHPAAAELAELNRDGRVLRSVPTGLTECHGITTCAGVAGAESFLIADTGRKRDPATGYKANRMGPPQVIHVSATLAPIQRLQPPRHAAYEAAAYAPTAAVQAPASGDLWVADGYGASLVHRYNADGSWRSSLTGEEGGGRFRCPHAVWIDRRRSEPELYVADRGNARIQVYDLDGVFKRLVRDPGLQAPSGFAAHGELLFVVDLNAAVAVLDREDRLVGLVGENRATLARPGWPNALDPGGEITRPPLQQGLLNSPHAVAVDDGGCLYIAEWVIGGRIVRLEPIPG